MDNLDRVLDAIEELEQQEINYTIASRLADLYIVRDHIVAGASADYIDGNSEFLSAVKSADAPKVWQVLDELMSTLQVLNRRLYDGVIFRLTGR